jgi:3',5'-cyclic AMP phosphodiesterase CpdA
LSDLHIHTDENNNEDVISLFTGISEKFNDHTLIITGDITDDGTREQYQNALQLLKPFKDRVFVCPGNHDFGALGNFYSEERARRFDEYLSAQLGQGGTFKGDSTPVVNIVKDGGVQIMLIALDSNLETENCFDFACGEIGESQLRSLDTILTSCTNMVKVLFFHHHPFIVNDPFMELEDAEKLARVVYGKADLVLFGHKHEMKQWAGRWGTKYILASDNSPSPGKKHAKEIVVDSSGNIASVEVVQVYP